MINFSYLKYLIIAVMTLIFLALFSHKAFSVEITDEQKLKEMYYQSVNDEIVRHHEKEMADRQIEILGRLQMLGASQTEVNQGVSVQTTVTKKVKGTM